MNMFVDSVEYLYHFISLVTPYVCCWALQVYSISGCEYSSCCMLRRVLWLGNESRILGVRYMSVKLFCVNIFILTPFGGSHSKCPMLTGLGRLDD